MNHLFKFFLYFLTVNIFFNTALGEKSNLIYSSMHVLEVEEFKIDEVGSLYNSENGFRPTFYFDFLDDNQIILSKGNGEIFIFYKDKEKFVKKSSNLDKIFQEQINKSELYKQRFGGPGVRDIRYDSETNNLFVSFLSTKTNHCLKLEILKASLEKLLFEKFWETPCVKISNAHSTGGTLEVYKNYIYLTIGDFWDENNDNAQNKNSYFGKILKFDIRKININKNKIEPDIFSIGHRNPQGLQILKEDILISTEHGPAGGDEINIIKKYKNYGWPIVSDGQPYNLKSPEKFKKKLNSNYEEPIFTFLRSVGISSIVLYDQEKLSRWNQSFIVGTLKNRSIYRLKFKKNSEETYTINGVECIKIGQRIRKLRVNSGDLFMTTDEGKFLILKSYLNDYGINYNGPDYSKLFGSFTGPMNFCD